MNKHTLVFGIFLLAVLLVRPGTAQASVRVGG